MMKKATYGKRLITYRKIVIRLSCNIDGGCVLRFAFCEAQAQLDLEIWINPSSHTLRTGTPIPLLNVAYGLLAFLDVLYVRM